LSLVVEDPTIIPAELTPEPATPLAWLAAPPSVPKSVTVNAKSAFAWVKAMRHTKNAAQLVFNSVIGRPG
jgi:hypothetical protein